MASSGEYPISVSRVEWRQRWASNICLSCRVKASPWNNTQATGIKPWMPSICLSCRGKASPWNNTQVTGIKLWMPSVCLSCRGKASPWNNTQVTARHQAVNTQNLSLVYSGSQPLKNTHRWVCTWEVPTKSARIGHAQALANAQCRFEVRRRTLTNPSVQTKESTAPDVLQVPSWTHWSQ